MTDIDSVNTLGLIHKLWPKTKEAWPDEVATEFMVACGRIRIEWNQAEAAIKALSMRSRFQTIKPVESLEALRNAVARVTEERRVSAAICLPSFLEAAVNERLKSLPADLRQEALLRIDYSLPETESRGALADNLANAASMAENGDWNGALEWPLFRHEVKETPCVRDWLKS